MMALLNNTAYGKPGPVPVNPVEKRSGPRYAFSSTAEVTDIQAGTRLVGRLSDISRNGCYVDTLNPFPECAAVTLTITKGNESFKTQAKVVYSKSGMGMGLLFTTAEPQQLTVLGSWLSELSGERVIATQAPAPTKQAPTPIAHAKTANAADQELRNIVGELITLLNGKGFLDDSEGMALLRKLSK
jgi:hypothetical protein